MSLALGHALGYDKERDKCSPCSWADEWQGERKADGSKKENYRLLWVCKKDTLAVKEQSCYGNALWDPEDWRSWPGQAHKWENSSQNPTWRGIKACLQGWDWLSRAERPWRSRVVRDVTGDSVEIVSRRNWNLLQELRPSPAASHQRGSGRQRHSQICMFRKSALLPMWGMGGPARAWRKGCSMAKKGEKKELKPM